MPVVLLHLSAGSLIVYGMVMKKVKPLETINLEVGSIGSLQKRQQMMTDPSYGVPEISYFQ